jgi:tetratricopeptide (TPR) repeat protein
VAASTAVEAALGENGSGSGDAAKRVAEATQAGIVVLGSYSRFGDSLRMQASLVNPRNGKVIRAIEPSTGPLSDPMIAIGGLRERLLGSIVTGDLARQVTLASSPPKYSAWLEYMAGSREFNANNNQAGSRPYFERAIALDSTFAVAYGFLAVTYTNAGRYDQAEEVVRRLEAQRDRLSSYDRLVLDYQRFHIAGDIPQIVRLASEVFARSADPIFAYSIGFWSLRILRPDLAIPALKASHDHETRVGWEGQARDEALAFHQAGDYRAQLAALDSGTVNTPDGASGYRNSKLSAYAGLGDAATALALADTLLRQATPGDSGVITAVGNGASEFDAHGDSATASQLNLMTLRWADENHSAKPSIGWERAVGTRWLFSGNLDSAQAHLERALPDSSVNAITTISYLAIIAVQHGDSARARFVVDSIAATVPKWDRGRTPFVQAVILAELGERARALQLLKTVPGVGGSMINWHTALGLRSLRGYAPFEALITPRK